MRRLIAHPATLPAAAAALVIAIVVTAMAFIGIYQSRVNAVTHTFQVERELVRFLAVIQEGELAARGYVRVQDEPFLSQFYEASEAAPLQLNKIEELVRDNPEQAAVIPQLRQMVSEKFEDSLVAFAERRAGAPPASIATFTQGRSYELMQQLSAAVSDMEARESRLLEQRNEEASSTGLVSVALGVAAIVAALTIILFWFLDRTRSTTALRNTLAEQEATLASLRRSQEVVAREAAGRAQAESQLRQVHKMEA
ncbi:MAG: CHASE3 domain-containing protein, partial [Microvirga sp.]